ncbi:MAG: low-complexity tail membrane protein [Leptolyngbyaceae cyanobacterium RU_5_1]|nr:low-complexity tail membrane protein [Leptolyngbyaceae cyanobacterium RU_5_1]
MRSFWSDPYLWIHLAGLAALPIWLELCVLGLAVGDPVLPVWLELLLISVVGIVPVLRMQWRRPFYIFSLVAVALKPEQLTDDQRRLLTLFKSQRNRVLAIAAALLLFIALRQLYDAAPIAAAAVPFSSSSRWLGLLVAAIAFLGSNLFLQVPVSVLSIMLTSETTFAATPPYATDQIRQDFTLLGLPVHQILPPVIPEPEPSLATAPSGIPNAAVQPAPPFDLTQAESLPSESAPLVAPAAAAIQADPVPDPWIPSTNVETDAAKAEEEDKSTVPPPSEASDDEASS